MNIYIHIYKSLNIDEVRKGKWLISRILSQYYKVSSNKCESCYFPISGSVCTILKSNILN